MVDILCDPALDQAWARRVLPMESFLRGMPDLLALLAHRSQTPNGRVAPIEIGKEIAERENMKSLASRLGQSGRCRRELVSFVFRVSGPSRNLVNGSGGSRKAKDPLTKGYLPHTSRAHGERATTGKNGTKSAEKLGMPFP